MSSSFEDRLASVLTPKVRRCATCRALAELSDAQRERFEVARPNLNAIDQARVLGVNESTYRAHLSKCL